MNTQNQPLSQRTHEFEDLRFFYTGFKSKDPLTTNVEVGQVAISKNQLITEGLLTCSALGFNYNGQNVLGHFEARTSKNKLSDEIGHCSWFNEFRQDKDSEIYLWEGDGPYTQYALNIIGTSLENLGLLNKLKYLGQVSAYYDTVGINSRGPFLEGVTNLEPEMHVLDSFKTLRIV